MTGVSTSTNQNDVVTKTGTTKLASLAVRRPCIRRVAPARMTKAARIANATKNRPDSICIANVQHPNSIPPTQCPCRPSSTLYPCVVYNTVSFLTR